MTQGHPAPWSGTPVPEPLDIARATDDLVDAMHALGIAERAMAAEQQRLRVDGSADRQAVLTAWRASVALLAQASATAQAAAAALNRLAIDAAKVLNRLEPDSTS